MIQTTLYFISGDRCHNLKELDVSDSSKLTALTISTVNQPNHALEWFLDAVIKIPPQF